MIANISPDLHDGEILTHAGNTFGEVSIVTIYASVVYKTERERTKCLLAKFLIAK
jgi:hypothetical protein